MPLDTKLIPLTQWQDHHPYPSTAGLRWLVFNEKTNGFHKAVKRIGRRVLIDEQAYFEWVENLQDTEVLHGK